MQEKISFYKIIKKIGAGGMGEVYLATDERLNRKIALKILPADVSNDRKKLNRFMQEARLVANLNHPNICTIYEVGETSETPFLAMELIEGETLTDKIKNSSLGLSEILQITTQIADALDEAHQNKIIHRDIKSSNVLINQRGQAKLLDFGLAKTVADEVFEQDITRAKTEEGMLIGTVQYMSPEHALGKKLDARTDLWSLGVLLYEMTCGAMPFKAATQAGVFDEILNKPPLAPHELSAEIPAELEQIILKLLEKDRDLRYQTASDLRADLKRLRRSLGETSDSGEFFKTSTSEFVKTVKTSETEHSKSNFVKLALTSLIVLFVLGGIIFLVYGLSGVFNPKTSFAEAKSSRLTNLGKVFDAVLSPDGKYAAYVTDDGAKQTLWVKQITTGSVVQVAAPAEVLYQGLAISPDSSWVYYNFWDKKSVGQIFRVPVLGGNSQKVVFDCMPGISVSPDGNRIVFTRSNDQTKRLELLTANAVGADEKEIPTKDTFAVNNALWSPDGNSVAYIKSYSDLEKRVLEIVEVDLNGNELKRIWADTDNKYQLNSFAWLPEKRGIVASLQLIKEFQSQVWEINYSDGQMKQITKDFNGYNALSASADGKNLLAVQRDFLASVWNVPIDNSAQAKRLTEGKFEGIGIAFTSENRLLYSSNISGGFEIWSMNLDGSDKKQLTSDAVFKVTPCAVNPAKLIFFNAVGAESGGVARMDFDGKNFKILDGIWNVFCASDAPRIFYSSSTDGKNAALFYDSVEKNAQKKVTDKPIRSYAVSPNGKFAAYVYWNDAAKSYAAEIIEVETGKIKPFEIPVTAVQKYSDSQFTIRFTPDNKNLSYVNDENGFSNVWLLPLNGEKPKRLTNFNDNYIYTFEWAKDGKSIGATRVTSTNDAVIFSKEK
ncbi:MAG TPA: protein kinase [Pyrinomonadaceae bacterium]|nr:protein kinase [Pyrinomonadaceae bacterium]